MTYCTTKSKSLILISLNFHWLRFRVYNINNQIINDINNLAHNIFNIINVKVILPMKWWINILLKGTYFQMIYLY